jgi:serine protease Do
MPNRRSSPSSHGGTPLTPGRSRPGSLGRATSALLAALLLVPPALMAQSVPAPPSVDVEALTRAVRPSVVAVFSQQSVTTGRVSEGKPVRRTRTRVGSGVAVEGNAILTTASVVRDAERVIVMTSTGRQVDARVLGEDALYNLALLQVDDVQLPPVLLATQRASQVGDWVFTLGTSYRGETTQSVGTIATLYRDPRLPLFQLSNTAYPGNSGGAALNARGELIGLVQGEMGSSASLSRPELEQRPGACIVLPVETIVPVYRAIRSEGRMPHGFLGVQTRNAGVDSDTEPGLRVPIGALVESVQPTGPAARAGLEKGDLIVGFERDRVEYADQLARWVTASRPRSQVELVWVRGDVRHSARVMLGQATDSMPRVAQGTPSSSSGPSAARIAELEKQIQRLNVELQRLKTSN